MPCSLQQTKQCICQGCDESFRTLMPNLVIKEILEEKTVKIDINNHFTFGTSTEFLDLGKQCFFNNTLRHIIIDMRHIELVSQIDSSALGMLMLLHEKAPNAKFEFLNMSSQIQKIFEITRLEERLKQ